MPTPFEPPRPPSCDWITVPSTPRTIVLSPPFDPPIDTPCPAIQCERLFICKPVNVVTKSVPSSGKSTMWAAARLLGHASTIDSVLGNGSQTGRLSPRSMVSRPMVLTRERRTSSSSESMSTTTRLRRASTSLEPSWSTLSLEPWTLSEVDPLDRSSDLTTCTSTLLASRAMC